MKRWKEAVSVLIVTVVICCGVCGRIYAGEFGGFDVDIGTEEDIFDNWEETSETEIPEPEPKPEVTEPKSESVEPEPRPEATESKSESAEPKPRSEAAEPKPESAEPKPRPETAEPKPEPAESQSKPQITELKPKPAEPKQKIAEPKPTEPKSEALDSGMKAAGQKKKKIKNGSRNASKNTALGVVLVASGMSKTSPELNFYNKNDENGKKKENKMKYNNCNVKFEHSETIDINEYPEIKMVRTADEQDITVLSLRVDGEEIFWHQKGDILIFDQPVTKKNATVELVVAVDGMQIVKMPVWTI
nr:hypothetical protein [uncultured Blautia sp.]